MNVCSCNVVCETLSEMRVKEAASIVVNMPKKKHKHAKKTRVATDTSGWFNSFFNIWWQSPLVMCKYSAKRIIWYEND